MKRALYDPQTSGGLLIALAPRRAAEMLAALRRRRVWAVEIGEAVGQERRRSSSCDRWRSSRPLWLTPQ